MWELASFTLELCSGAAAFQNFADFLENNFFGGKRKALVLLGALVAIKPYDAHKTYSWLKAILPLY